MIGMIAASPSSGSKPRSRSAPRNQRVFSRSFETRSGRVRSTCTAARALHATVGGSAFENSCGRERCASRSHTSADEAT